MIKTAELTKNHIIRSITYIHFTIKYRGRSMQSRSNFNAQSYDLSGEGSHIANTISALQFFISRLLPADGIFARKGRENGSGNLYELYLSFRDCGVECRSRWRSSRDRGGQTEITAPGNIHFDAQCFSESSHFASCELSSLPTWQSR